MLKQQKYKQMAKRGKSGWCRIRSIGPFDWSCMNSIRLFSSCIESHYPFVLHSLHLCPTFKPTYSLHLIDSLSVFPLSGCQLLSPICPLVLPFSFPSPSRVLSFPPSLRRCSKSSLSITLLAILIQIACFGRTVRFQ